MYKSVLDDSVTYYSNDIPTNFVRTARAGARVFDGNYFDRVDSAVMNNTRVNISLHNPLLQKYGRTANKKKRTLNHMSDSLDQDSLMEETGITGPTEAGSNTRKDNADYSQ